MAPLRCWRRSKSEQDIMIKLMYKTKAHFMGFCFMYMLTQPLSYLLVFFYSSRWVAKEAQLVFYVI